MPAHFFSHFALANIDTSRESSDSHPAPTTETFDGASEESGSAEIYVISYTAAADASAATVSAGTHQFVYYTRVHASDGRNRTVVTIPSGKKRATWLGPLTKRHPVKAARDTYYGEPKDESARRRTELCINLGHICLTI